MPPQSATAEVLYRYDPPQRTPIVQGKIRKPMRTVLAEAKQSTDVLPILDREEHRQEIQDQLVESSCAYFAANYIIGPKKPPFKGRFLIRKHHLAWDRAFTKSTKRKKRKALRRKLLIEAARGHGKSYTWSLAFPIWMAGWVMPGSLGYIFSANQELAEQFLEIIKQQIESNPKLQHLIPLGGTRICWTKREIRLANGSVIRARGWGVRVRGGHPQWIVCDDVLDDESLYSETIRRRATNYYFSVISNMGDADTYRIIVGTPQHFADLYAKIKETKKYKCMVFPAEDKTGTPLFPERYNRQQLNEKKEEIGPTRYAREFQCSPLSDEASLFPTKLFEGDIRLPYSLGMDWRYWEERGMARYTGVDLAFSAEMGSDYTVIFTIAVDDFGNRWIANIRRGQGWSFDRQLAEIREEDALMKPDTIYIESNQAQRVFGDQLTATTAMNITLFFTSGSQPKKPWQRGMTQVTMGKHSLDRGVPSLRLLLERRKWRIPRGDPESIELTDLWIGELNCISYQDGKVMSVGEHDDLCMATWIANSAARWGAGIEMTFAGEDEKTEQATRGGNGEPEVADSIDELSLKPTDTPKVEEEEEWDFFGLNADQEDPDKKRTAYDLLDMMVEND